MDSDLTLIALTEVSAMSDDALLAADMLPLQLLTCFALLAADMIYY